MNSNNDTATEIFTLIVSNDVPMRTLPGLLIQEGLFLQHTRKRIRAI